LEINGCPSLTKLLHHISLLLQRCSPVSGAPRDILEPKALADNNENTSDVEENDVRRRLNLDQQVGIDSDITEVCPLYDCCGRFETMCSSFCVVLKYLN